MHGRDAFPRSVVFRAELVRDAGGYTATLELPDGSLEDLSAESEVDARADLLAAVRRFLDQHGHQFGRLTVADPDHSWELVLPADDGQEPVVLGEVARISTDPVDPARGPVNGEPPPSAQTDGFPADPTLAATIARTGWGQYSATLTLPDGQEHAFAGAELDTVRGRVLEDTRSYLATRVRHAGRLEVTDPDGTWVLGVPHDGGDVVALESASALTTPRIARTGVPRPSRPSRVRSPRSRRFVASRHDLAARIPGANTNRAILGLGLLAAVILALIVLQAVGHDSSTTAAKVGAKHVRSVVQTPVVRTTTQQQTTASSVANRSKAMPTHKPVRKTAPTRTTKIKTKTNGPSRTRHKPSASKTPRPKAKGAHQPAASPHTTPAASIAPSTSAAPSAPAPTYSSPAPPPSSQATGSSSAPSTPKRSDSAAPAPVPTRSGPPPL